MTLEEKEKVVDYIKHHIHEEDNSYCRIGFAIETIMSKEHKVRIADITSILAKVTKDGMYYSKTSGYNKNDFDIFAINELELKNIEDKNRISELTIKNLELQNMQLKRYVLYSVIGFFVGAIVTNLKDILTLLNIVR